MSDDKKETGLMFCRDGSNSLIVRVVERRDDKRYTPQTPGYWWVGDKTAYVRDLILRGHAYESHGTARFYNDRPCFRPMFSEDITEDVAAGMAATLRKITKQCQKDAAFDEEGDKFLAMARAIGAKFVCVPATEGRKITESWERTSWNWLSLSDGRNTYRNCIAAVMRDVQAAHDREVAAGAKILSIVDNSQAA